MADVFSKIPVDVKKGSSDMMSEASTNLIHGMGNVLDTFSYSAAIETEKTEEEMAAANKTAAESKVFLYSLMLSKLYLISLN